MSAIDAVRRTFLRTGEFVSRPWVFATCAAVVAAVCFLPFTRLGVDPQHDGFMFTSALAVSKGWNVQSEVYAQYGPIAAWIQALELSLFGPRLLTIRVATSIVLVAATALFAVAARRTFGLWPATVAIGSWLACAPFFDPDLSMIPWTSDYFLLFTAVCVVLATSPFWNRDEGRRAISQTSIGAILGVTLFLRINPAIPTLVVVLGAAFVYGSWTLTRRIATGAIGSIVLVGVALFWNDAVREWWLQSIRLPGEMYTGLLGDSGFSGLQGNILVNGVPAVLGVVCLFVAANLVIPTEPPTTLQTATRWASTVAGVAMFVWLFLRHGSFQLLNPRLFLWGVVLGVIVLLPLLLKQLEIASEIKLQVIVFTAIGVGSLTQVVPVVDRRHLWWATLPGLILLMAFLDRLDRLRWKRITGAVLVLALAIPASVNAHSNLSIKRVEFTDTPVLEGMLASTDYSAAFGGAFALIDKFQEVHGDKSVLNLCADGLYASLGAKYDYPDPFFVDWVFPRKMWSDRARAKFVKDNSPLMWLCWPELDPKATADSYGYRLVERPKCLAGIERFSAWPLAGQLAVPKTWDRLPLEDQVMNENVCDGLTR